jgi:hypothetical protein
MILVCQANNQEEIDDIKSIVQVFVISERIKQQAKPT